MKRKRINIQKKLSKRITSILLAGVITTTGFIFGVNNIYAQSVDSPAFTRVYSTKSGNKLLWNYSKKSNGYIVYRSIDGGKFTEIDVTKSKKYTDSDIETGKNYRYKVKPFNVKKNKYSYGKKSDISKEISALPLGVEGVSVVSFSNRKYISWNANPMASGYKVYRSVNGGEWTEFSDVDSNREYVEDFDIVKGNNYKYKVYVYEIINGKKYVSVYTLSSNSPEKKGIDVSYYNGVINWKKVKKAGISFAMIRMGYGTAKGGIIDSQLDYNYKNAKKNGIKVGLYLYSYADNVKEAKNEAKFTLKMLKKYGDLDYPMAFDFENTYRNKKKYKKSNTKIIKTYCDYLENQGYDTSVYSYVDFFKTSVKYKEVSKYGIWLARWTHKTKKFDDYRIPNVQMWQYSDNGRVKGISGAVDTNLNILREK